jgi:poly-gamma-glutamate capsule biosynthesis protein CapA/YwtB (metallophosphatase superfamily)
MKKLSGIFLLALMVVSLSAQQDEKQHLTLLFAGDIMGHDEQIAGAWDSISQSYNYEPVFRYVKPIIEKYDLAIGNLEVTLAGPPYKGYPAFSSPDALATAARDAGFDVLIQANNHALDRSVKGFKRTLSVLDSLQIPHTGAFADSADRAQHYPLILEKNGYRIALLNYTYATNGLTISKPWIINRIDTATIRKDLEKAKQNGYDFTIVTIHWGVEYQRLENADQQKTAAFILRHGADAIIGSHPHVVEPIKLYFNSDSTESHIVVYSLGNFVSNQRAQYKDGGIMFAMELAKTPYRTVVDKFGYIPTWVYRQDNPGRYGFYILPVSLAESRALPVDLSEKDQEKLARFATDTRELLKGIPEISPETPNLEPEGK